MQLNPESTGQADLWTAYFDWCEEHGEGWDDHQAILAFTDNEYERTRLAYYVEQFQLHGTV